MTVNYKTLDEWLDDPSIPPINVCYRLFVAYFPGGILEYDQLECVRLTFDNKDEVTLKKTPTYIEIENSIHRTDHQIRSEQKPDGGIRFFGVPQNTKNSAEKE